MFGRHMLHEPVAPRLLQNTPEADQDLAGIEPGIGIDQIVPEGFANGFVKPGE